MTTPLVRAVSGPASTPFDVDSPSRAAEVGSDLSATGGSCDNRVLSRTLSLSPVTEPLRLFQWRWM